jgi:hypothetical protein
VTTSAIPAALDWLVSACKTGVTPVGGVMIPVYVQDGPLATMDPLVFPQRLAIGWDSLNPNEPGVDGHQEFASLGTRLRDERFDIVCTAEDWSGDVSMKPRRDNCFGLVAQVELLIRGAPPRGPGDTTMGGSVVYSQISGPLQFHMSQDPSGASATCVFRISARARLTT